MCAQSLHMLCSNKHLDMYVLCIDIFNKQADIFPFRIAKYDILSQCSVRCSSQSRDALVWRALMSRPGARKWSAHNWFGACARRQCTKPGVVRLLRTAPGWRVFLQRKLEHSYTLDHGTWHRDTTTNSTHRQSSAQCRSWSTRPWHAPGHVAATHHTSHYTSHTTQVVFAQFFVTCSNSSSNGSRYQCQIQNCKGHNSKNVIVSYIQSM